MHDSKRYIELPIYFFQRGRHRGSRGQDDGASSDAAGSNFGNRAQE